jgi:putative lysine transport system permease protein
MILSTFSDIASLLSKGEYVRWFFLGTISTILLSILGTVLGLILGVFLAFGKRIVINTRDRWYTKTWKYFVKYLCVCYSVIIRGTPMMVQAMIFQYACLNLGVNWSMLFNNNQIFSGWFFGGLIVLTFNTAAYMGEIVQSGLNGVGKDQTEGARSLGMSEFKTLFIVELPQALKNAIPTIGNEWIVNIKDSSVLNIVGVTELFFMAKNTAGQSYKILATYLIIAVIYLFLTLITTLILKLVTMKLNHQKIKIKLFHFRKEYVTNEK